MGETYLMGETNYFGILCSVQNPHPCVGQVEHVYSHSTEILVSLHLTPYTCNLKLCDEETEEKNQKVEYCVILDSLAFIACLSIVLNIQPVLDFNKQN